jgi:hypothetical protein
MLFVMVAASRPRANFDLDLRATFAAGRSRSEFRFYYSTPGCADRRTNVSQGVRHRAPNRVEIPVEIPVDNTAQLMIAYFRSG